MLEVSALRTPGLRIHLGIVLIKLIFRQLFADCHWETETGRQRGTDQEHAFVPIIQDEVFYAFLSQYPAFVG